MENEEKAGPARKRERSHRYPRRNLAQSLELAKFVEERGLDGFPAGEIATALGFSSIKTNTFSGAVSAARQFGLLDLKSENYGLTPLARSILHPVNPAEVPALIRQSLWSAPLYEELARRFSGKTLPDAAILANLLYHQFDIIVGAKDLAAAVFVESARFAGALGADGILRPEGGITVVDSLPVEKPKKPRSSQSVRLDLRLWGDDEGKTIRFRSPEKITKESYERLLQAFALVVRIEP